MIALAFVVGYVVALGVVMSLCKVSGLAARQEEAERDRAGV